MKRALLIVVPVLALAAAAGAWFLLLRPPSHEEIASRVKTVCADNIAKAHGAVLGESITATMGNTDLNFDEAGSHAADAGTALSIIANDAGSDDAKTLEEMADAARATSESLATDALPEAYESGAEFVSTAEREFDVACDNPGGDEKSTQAFALADVNAACDRYRPMIAEAAGDLGDLADISDEAGATKIDLIGSRSKRFASALSVSDIDGVDEMIDALQSASRSLITASGAWSSGFYASANADLESAIQDLYRALDEGETLGAASCAREP